MSYRFIKNDEKNAVDFIRDIISIHPWEPKATTLKRLAKAYVAQKNGAHRQVTKEDVDEIINAIEILKWNGEIKIVAGMGWKQGVEFIFQAVG